MNNPTRNEVPIALHVTPYINSWVLRPQAMMICVKLGFNTAVIPSLSDPSETLLTSPLGPLLVQQLFSVYSQFAF